MHGISFETLPSVWSDKSIFPALTYAQCVEIEGYWDKYHGAGNPQAPPIPYDSWVKYFAQDGESPPCRWTLKNIIKNWREAKAKYHKNGVPKVTKRADSKAVHEKMLQYHQHAMIAIAAASPAIIIEDVKKIEDDSHQSQAGSRQLDVLDHAPLAADLSPVRQGESDCRGFGSLEPIPVKSILHSTLSSALFSLSSKLFFSLPLSALIPTGGGQLRQAALSAAAGPSRSRMTSTPRAVRALQSLSPAELAEGSAALQHRVPPPAVPGTVSGHTSCTTRSMTGS